MSSNNESLSSLSTSDHYPDETDDSTETSIQTPKPKRNKYYQTYRKKWEEEVSWLAHSRKGDRYAYCKVCNKDLSCSEGGLKDIKRHGSTESHNRLAKSDVGQQTLTKAWNKELTISMQAARAEAVLCNMLVEHNLPFLVMDHLPGLLSHAFPDSKIAKEVKCARTKSTAVVKHAIAPASHKSMISMVSLSPAFSLLMDESTDRGVVKREGTLIRYYDESTLHIATGFLGLQEVPEANASNLFECLDFHITQASLSYEKLIGWNSDGASVMLGRRNSVVSRLKEKQPNLYVMHCICHVSHLIVSDAIPCIPSYVTGLTENLYWWFHHSAKRVTELRSFQEWLEVEGHKILKKVDTRWLSLEACVNRIIEQYAPLMSYFDSLESSRMPADRGAKMKAIREQLKKPITKAYLLFLSNILSYISKFNLLFQCSSPNIHCLLKEMQQLLLRLLNKFIIPHAIQSASCVTDVDISIANQRQDDDLMIGTSLRAYLRELEDELLGTTELANFYKDVRAFLSKLVTSTLKRLPFDDPVINDIACLDPTERLNSTTGMIRRLMECFSNFVPCDKGEQIEEEFALYQTMKDLPPDIPTNAHIDVFWGKLGKLESSTGRPFGLLSDFAKCLLCIPHGNADSERMFSCINLIVTDHRNQLDTSTIEACLDIKINSNCVDCRKYEPSHDVVKATRKVTPGSELAPKAGSVSFPSFSCSSSSSHNYGTRRHKT